MEQIHERVAGLDVHRDSVSACARVPGVRREVVTHKARFRQRHHWRSGSMCRCGVQPLWRPTTEARASSMRRSSRFWRRSQRTSRRYCSQRPCPPSLSSSSRLPMTYVTPNHTQRHAVSSCLSLMAS